MMPYVYLIKNGGLHKIGRTDNLERRLKQLQPCQVIQTLETDRSRDLEFELHSKYKHARLPQTEYFRLTDKEVEEVRVALGWSKPQLERRQEVRNGELKELDPKTGYWRPVPGDWNDPGYSKKMSRRYWGSSAQLE